MTPSDYPVGRIVIGDSAQINAARERFFTQKIDQTHLHEGVYPYSLKQTSIGDSISVSGPGTFLGKEQRTLTFAPTPKEGWWIDRTDLDEQLATPVSIRSVWTTARNIVLRSGSPHNYLRMVEHIIALRIGMGVDNLMLRTDSGDPPLFDRGNLDLVEAIDKVGIVETDQPAKFVTVKEPVTFGGVRGDFLTFLPAKPGDLGLHVDCAVDFASAIGKQRIIFDVTPESFRHGAAARTNAPYSEYLYAHTVGKIFADTRNLGYTRENILIHKKRSYLNEAKLIHDGRSLEAVWHRATLDLLAAIALIDAGRFAGTLVSYRAGHTQDVRMVAQLYLNDLLKSHS